MPADPYTSLILKMVNPQFSDIDLINDTISQTRVTPAFQILSETGIILPVSLHRNGVKSLSKKQKGVDPARKGCEGKEREESERDAVRSLSMRPPTVLHVDESTGLDRIQCKLRSRSEIECQFDQRAILSRTRQGFVPAELIRLSNGRRR